MLLSAEVLPEVDMLFRFRGKSLSERSLFAMALAVVFFVSAGVAFAQCGCSADGQQSCDCFCGYKQTFWSRRANPYCEAYYNYQCQYESCQTSASTTTCAQCNNIGCTSYDTYTCVPGANGLSYCPCVGF
jgi:hypothetical protein